MTLRPRTRTWRVWATAFAVMGAWLLFAHVFVPWLIGWSYGGHGPAFLGKLVTGTSEHSLELYLGRWREVTRSLTFVLATICLAIATVTTFGSLVRAKGGAPLGREPQSSRWSRFRIRLLDLMPVAAWFGLVVGLGEAWYLAGRGFFVHQVIPGFRQVSVDSIWMVPVADVLIFAGLGVLIVLLGLLFERHRAFVSGVFVLSVTGALVLLRVPDRISAVAALILALGLAYRIAGYVSDKPGAFRSAARSSLIPLVGIWAIAAGVVRVSHGADGAGAPVRESSARSDRPNVILVILDTVRAASLGVYGHERQNTPNMERLAKRGILFERAISPSSWTLPSHATMFTGRFNHELGTSFLTPLDDTYPTLAEELASRGYATGGFVANLVFCTEWFGLGRGFERYVGQPIDLPMLLSSSWLVRHMAPKVRAKFGNHQPLIRKRATDVNDEFLRWLSEIEGRPYFAFLNYFDGHGPYLPPEPFNRLYWPSEQPRYWLGSDYASDFTPGELEQLQAAYDGSIAYLDDQLGRLIEALERRGHLQNTVVIVTSDHGESFGEHGTMGHGRSIYMTEIHVPLLVLLPDSAFAGTRLSDPVSLRNVAATVMDLVGDSEESRLPGVSLARHWTGNASDAAPIDGDYVFSQLAGKRSITLGRYHYWKDRQGNEELYDLTSDPDESVNLIGTGEEELTLRMRAELERAPGASETEPALETAARSFP